MDKKALDIMSLLSSHINDYDDDDRDDIQEAIDALGWLSAADLAHVDTSSRCPVTVAEIINCL